MRTTIIALRIAAILGILASCSDDGGRSTCADVERERAALVEPSTNEAWNDIDELEAYASELHDLADRAEALGC